MSSKASSTTIGAFVVGATVLLVAGIAYFGSGRFLAETQTYVLYFDGSLSGLRVGAPVLFRGIKIGQVSEIAIRYDVEKQGTGESPIEMPVYIETEPRRIEKVGGEITDRQGTMELLIEQGLRATLAMESFVTGMLAIELDFKPETEVRLVGGDTRYIELPTVPSAIAEATETLLDLPIAELVDDLREAIQGVNELVRAQVLKDTLQALEETVVDFGKLARDINAQVDPVATSVTDAARAAESALRTAEEKIVSAEESLGATLKTYRDLGENIGAEIDPLAKKLTEALESARTALEQGRRTLAESQSVLARDSELHHKFVVALDELAGAGRSIRVLADYLEQHPEALLQGKGAPGGK